MELLFTCIFTVLICIRPTNDGRTNFSGRRYGHLVSGAVANGMTFLQSSTGIGCGL